MKRLFLIFLVAIAANAQQNALILPWITQHFTNTNGTPLANGKVCTYQAGTSTGLATYTDSTASVANNVPPNAILLDSTGPAPGIWLKVGVAYKIVVLTAGSDSTCNTGVTVKTQDNVVGQAGASLTGNNPFTGNSTHGGAQTFKNINLMRTASVGNAFDVAGNCLGEMGCIINNSIKDIPDASPEGIVIYAFGGGTISTNPWASIGNRSGIIYFGSQVFTTNISLQVPTAWKVEGYGRGAIADGKNTIIKAGASFPTSTPVMQMGLTPGPADGVQIRNLGIDCQNIAGVSGIQNQFSQEESLVEHVLFVNCPGGALSVSTSAAQNSGPYADLEVLNFSCSNCAAGTVPVSIGAVGSFRGIRGITINSNGSTLPTIALRIDAAGTYSDIHIESAVSSVVIGSVAGTSSVVMTNVECGPSITDCVKISNAFGTQNITLLGITSTTGNIITDQILSNTLTQAGEGGSVAAYITGNGSPPTLFTTSANFPKIVHLIVNGSATMTTAAISALSCGTVVTVGATGAATTDSITWSFHLVDHRDLERYNFLL
jgi:hypothetical protein